MTTPTDLIDTLRLAWRNLIKQTIHHIVTHPDQDILSLIDPIIAAHIPTADQASVKALIIDELRRLHEGVLARYGLRPSELANWKSRPL